jgi:Ca2+-binding EF-hand superfamily protein
MTMSRGLILTAAVCAALLAAGTVDAKGAKKKRAAQVAPAPSAAMMTPPAGGPAGMAGTPAPGPWDGEPLVLRYFDDIDADRNGQLSRTEITAWTEKVREQARARVLAQFKAADVNGDGQLSREEARAGTPQLYEHFEFVDANGDGQVSLAELAQLRDREQMRQRVIERLRAADANRDGKLDLAEVQVAFPGLAARFTLLDRDGDGYLTPDDVQHGLGGS